MIAVKEGFRRDCGDLVLCHEFFVAMTFETSLGVKEASIRTIVYLGNSVQPVAIGTRRAIIAAFEDGLVMA